MNKSITLPFLIVAITGLSSCENYLNHCIEGNGNRVSETRDLSPFEQIQVNGDFKVQVDTGAASSAEIQADDNLMGFIDTRVSDNKLIIESRNGGCLKPTHTIEIKVTTHAISNLELNGSGYLYSFGFQTTELALDVNGSGQIECNQLQASSVTYKLEGSGSIYSSVTAEDLAAGIDGSGEIRLSGTAASSELRVTGSGKIQSGQLITGVCTAYISGSGTVETYVNQALDVTISGSGIVYYDGDPAITSHISGSGKIVKQ